MGPRANIQPRWWSSSRAGMHEAHDHCELNPLYYLFSKVSFSDFVPNQLSISSLKKNSYCLHLSAICLLLSACIYILQLFVCFFSCLFTFKIVYKNAEILTHSTILGTWCILQALNTLWNRGEMYSNISLWIMAEPQWQW